MSETTEDFYSEELNDGTNIFVFGSNLLGIHEARAARTAARHWGARRGIGEGHRGSSYAIPTKKTLWETRSLEEIKESVDRFIDFAKSNPKSWFLVTRIGCGYAGYTDEQMAPMFRNCPENCVLPSAWTRFYV